LRQAYVDLEPEVTQPVTYWPDANLIEACVRVPVAKCPARIPASMLEPMEHNQQIASCCRHPENHDISAWYSSAEDRDKGVPDIYVFHCTCGKVHRQFHVGGSKTRVQLPDGTWGWEVTHPRIKWEIR
jgi:hypothetical protein